MAGSQVTVALGRHAYPPDEIDVDGHGYLLAVQSRPVTGRPWRYTVIRPGDLWVIDGRGRRADGGRRTGGTTVLTPATDTAGR